MNKHAEQHLAKAKDYVAIAEAGDSKIAAYYKAAGEIAAAQKADHTLTLREVDQRNRWSNGYASKLVRWLTSGAVGSPFGGEEIVERDNRARTKKLLREAPPEQIAEMLNEPEVRAKVSRAQEIAHEKIERRARTAEREALGPETDDALRGQQILRDAEAELFKARRALIETLRLLNNVDVGELPDSWREEFLRTLDDLAAKVELGRSLMTGTLDEELDKLLAGEI